MFPQFVINHLDILKPSIVQSSYRGDGEYSLAEVNIMIKHNKYDAGVNKFYYTS